MTILEHGVEKGVFDPPRVDGKHDLKAMAMALLDQCTHVSMWYGPGGDLTEEQMAEVGEFLQSLDDHDDVHRVGAAVK